MRSVETQATSMGIAIGVAAMAAVVVLSNILVQFYFGDWLTWGAFTYPFAFLVTDASNRLMGPSAARKVVFAGFLVGVACSMVAAGLDATTFRIALGSGIAFLTAQLLDVAVFSRLRDGAWWRAPLVSSVVGSAVDTALFFSIAFAAFFVFLGPNDDFLISSVPILGVGPEAPMWVSLAVADFGVKMTLALIALGPYRAITGRAAAT